MLLSAVSLYFLGLKLSLIQSMIDSSVEKRLKKGLSLSTGFLLFLSRKYDFAQKKFQNQEVNFIKKLCRRLEKQP